MAGDRLPTESEGLLGERDESFVDPVPAVEEVTPSNPGEMGDRVLDEPDERDAEAAKRLPPSAGDSSVESPAAPAR